MDLLPSGRGWARAALLLGIPLVVAGVGTYVVTAMPGRSFSGDPGPLSPELADLPERLRADVDALATGIGARGESAPAGLAKAEAWLTEKLGASGDTVVREPYQGRKREVANLRMDRRGVTRPDEIVVIGAHYDAVDGTSGADDNASGCAALVEIARLTAGRRFARTVRFEAWVDEEPPSFQTETMGSLVAARAARARGDDVRLAISLETIGFYSDRPGSQKYPRPFSLLYPDTGNFVGLVGNLDSRSELLEAVATFRSAARIPSEGVAAPDIFPGIGWSDQWSYWQVGYPGIMVTDTAPFRNPGYHTGEDRPEDLDYTRMARAVEGVIPVLADAAGEGSDVAPPAP